MTRRAADTTATVNAHTRDMLSGHTEKEGSDLLERKKEKKYIGGVDF